MRTARHVKPALKVVHLIRKVFLRQSAREEKEHRNLTPPEAVDYDINL